MAERETASSVPPKCGPYISSVTSRSMNLVIRGVVLFLIGVFLALVLNLLQIQRNVTLFPPDVIASIFSSAWWVPPCCGTASAVIGLLYPCIDRHLGEPHKFKREWSSVMRCVAVFVGINHASACWHPGTYMEEFRSYRNHFVLDLDSQNLSSDTSSIT